MTSLDRDGLLEAIVVWAEGTDLVRKVILTGSRARAKRPVDEWSDLDLVSVCTDRAPLIEDAAAWLEPIAPIWVALVHRGPLKDATVRQVVFAGGLPGRHISVTPHIRNA